MKKTDLILPEVALIASTRGMLGAEAALLLADKLHEDRRKAMGWTLLIVGSVSTIPLAIATDQDFLLKLGRTVSVALT